MYTFFIYLFEMSNIFKYLRKLKITFTSFFIILLRYELNLIQYRIFEEKFLFLLSDF